MHRVAAEAVPSIEGTLVAFRDPHTRRTLAFAVVAVALLGILFVVQRMRAPHSLGAREASALLQKDPSVVVLDVRTEAEFRSSTGRLERAILIPVDSLAKRMDELSRYRGRTILVYCRSGRRSLNASALLGRSGYSAVNLEGGILEWNAMGLPVVVEKER
jgi:rhodanese-related sulfurtransferase